MLRQFNKFIFVSLMLLGVFSALHASEKIYIDDEEFKADAKGDAFHIHMGNNVWFVTNTVHRDARGLFTMESSLTRSVSCPKMGYERRWKCPYCYNFWPIGTPCQNPDCPSKYRY